MKKLIVGIIWVTLAVVNSGFLNAWDRGDRRGFTTYCETHEARKILGTAMIFSLIPPMWFATPFFTGFYSYGWTLSAEPFAGCARDRR